MTNNNNIFDFDISNFTKISHEKCEISENKKNNSENNENQGVSKLSKITKKKKEVLKLLKNIGIDTRFISYTENKIYINDQRFSKFSKKRQKTFKKYYPEMDIVSSSIFQKICIRASKVLSEELSPKDKILLLKPKNSNDNLLKIVLEPYSRKYGVRIIKSEIESKDIDSYFNSKYNLDLDINEDINVVAKSMTLDEKVEDIFSNIFSGNGIGNIATRENNEFKVIYPFINTSNDLIGSFNNYIEENYENNNNTKNNEDNNNNNKNDNENDDIETCRNKNETSILISKSFMEFLKNIIPQYRENLLKSAIFIENKLNKKN